MPICEHLSELGAAVRILEALAVDQGLVVLAPEPAQDAPVRPTRPATRSRYVPCAVPPGLPTCTRAPLPQMTSQSWRPRRMGIRRPHPHLEGRPRPVALAPHPLVHDVSVAVADAAADLRRRHRGVARRMVREAIAHGYRRTSRPGRCRSRRRRSCRILRRARCWAAAWRRPLMKRRCPDSLCRCANADCCWMLHPY